jgi:hypothetical protein
MQETEYPNFGCTASILSVSGSCPALLERRAVAAMNRHTAALCEFTVLFGFSSDGSSDPEVAAALSRRSRSSVRGISLSNVLSRARRSSSTEFL